MSDWFSTISAGCELSRAALQSLRDNGFVVIPGPVSSGELLQLTAAYDSAMESASADDVHVGSTTTRVADFVNRSSEFDSLYVYSPILEACCHIIGRPFRLSTMHARSVRPLSPAQDLHVDFGRDADGWPMIGFIVMIDEFRRDNGATRFVPGSHNWYSLPSDVMNDPK